MKILYISAGSRVLTETRVCCSSPRSHFEWLLLRKKARLSKFLPWPKVILILSSLHLAFTAEDKAFRIYARSICKPDAKAGFDEAEAVRESNRIGRRWIQWNTRLSLWIMNMTTLTTHARH